jgi:glycosyltransferase involved in cell wall biosynthesis
MLTWGLALAGRQAAVTDEAIPFGFTRPILTPSDRIAATAALRGLGVHNDPTVPTLIYAGVLTRQLDVDGLVGAAELLSREGSRIKILVMGDGDRLGTLKDRTRHLGNLTLTGWVSQSVIAVAAEQAAAGLIAYRPTFDFESGLPNKVGEYLSYGLPVICSLRSGPTARFLKLHDAGIEYQFGDATSLAAACRTAEARWSARSRAPEDRLAMAQDQHLSADRSTNRLIAILEEMAAQPRTTS